MKCGRTGDIVLVMAALHTLVLSIVVGVRHIGYILAATLTAVMLWGVGLLKSDRSRRRWFVSGVVLAAVLQQVAYQAWKSQLPGFWWPLAQFAALQLLIALSIGRAAM